MEFLDWKDVYSVGVAQFDEEHLHIVHILNKLFREVQKDRLSAAIGPIIEELVHYAQFHFRNEEAELKRVGYPEYERHCVEHRQLEQKVLAYQALYRAGRLEEPQQLISFVKGWLTGHIMGSDALYEEFVKRQKP